MILWLVLTGLGLATLGTFAFAIDALSLFRMSSGETAREIYRGQSPTWKAPMGDATRDYVWQLAGMIAGRKRLYATGVLLLFAGFILQAIGTAF